jgi:hypothetical protein
MANWWSDRPERRRSAADGSIPSKGEGDGDTIVVTDTSTPHDLFIGFHERLTRQPERMEGLNAVFQFGLTGKRGGDFYMSIHDGLLMWVKA